MTTGSAEERAALLGADLDRRLAAGDLDGLCAAVADAFGARSDAGDIAEVVAVVSALPDDVIARCPRVVLELARACDGEGRTRLRTRLLDRAERLPVAEPDRVPFGLAVAAERIVDLARDVGGDAVEVAVAGLDALLAPAAGSVFAREARARASYALGRVLAWRGDPASVAAAEDALTTAAGAARELRRNEWRSQALQTLGYSVHFYRGEELRAASRLREAIDLLPHGHTRRAGVATFLADVYVRTHVGALALPVLDDIRREAAYTGDQRALGYAAWVAGVLASENGEPAATLEWLAEAERHPGDWFDHQVGTEFLADAALSAERVGETAAADRYLARCAERAAAQGHPSIAWLATGVLNARRGDPATAIDVLSRLLDEDWLAARDAWRIWLYRALARRRAGDDAGATRDATRCFEAAAALVGPGRAAATPRELPEVLIRLEGNAVRELAPLAAAAGSTVAAAIEPARTRVRLFGGLAVQDGTSAVPVPSGRTALLLMTVALDPRPISVDVAIDELWPEVTTEIGRRRLRNVLARIRAISPGLVTRTGDLLALGADTVLDLTEFDTACAAVDRAQPPERVALARTALELQRGDLLPEAAYLPRVIRRRDEVERRTVGLLRIVADDAQQHSRTDEALAALTRIAELDPYDTAVPARVAALLRDSGRLGDARRWERRMAELDAD